MSTNVYNIIWADDEIDTLIDERVIEDLKKKEFNLIGVARNGIELELRMKENNNIDAVIVDANFNETDTRIVSERDTSGLTYARSLYHRYEKKLPFFLYSGRSEELLKEIYQFNQAFLSDFPRHERWFSKNHREEYDEMLNKIKVVVDEVKSPRFILRNRYTFELNAASLFDAEDAILDFLVRDYTNTLGEIVEPFVMIRRITECLFDQCAKLKLIPPINDNINGTSKYFKFGEYKKDKVVQYRMLGTPLMPKPMAVALDYMVDITQDASHSKEGLKYKVDEYYKQTKDVMLLRSVAYILIDVIKWFATTALAHNDKEINEITLWEDLMTNKQQ